MTQPFPNARAAFADHLAQTNSPNTGRSYAWGLTKFSEWLDTFGPDRDWGAATPEDLLAFSTWLGQTGLSSGSARLAAKATVAFYRWAAAEGICEAKNVEPLMIPEPKPRARQPDLSVARYLGAVTKLTDPTRVVCALLPLTRISYTALCWAPLAGVVEDEQGRAIHVRARGSSMMGTDLVNASLDDLTRVSLTDSAVDELRRYLQQWRQVQADRAASPWLFPSPLDATHPVSPSTVGIAVRQVRSMTGAKRLTTMKIRRARR